VVLRGSLRRPGKPGQFRKIQVGSESVLVIRGRDGMLRAFLNVCRHRGAQLCTEPEGEVRRNIRCPYHAWTYALDGKLVAAPNIANLTDENGAGIDRYRYGLVPVALTEWLGYAWVCLADEPPSFADSVIGDVTNRLGDPTVIDRYGIEDLQVGHREVYDVSANWKLIVENFMECYHCASIHPELVDVLPEFSKGLAAQYYVGHGAEFGSGRSRVHRRRLGRFRHASGHHRRTGPPLLRDHGQADGVHQPSSRPHHLPPDVPDVGRSHRRRMRLALHPRRRLDGPRRDSLGRAVPPRQSAGLRGLRANAACDVVTGVSERRCTRSCRTPHRGVPSVGSVPTRR